MAGDWIKMRIDLATEPEVIGIANLTGLDEDTVVGKLLRLWGWADQKTTDGNATCVTESFLDRHIGVVGFSKAMVSVGWLEVVEPDQESQIGEIRFTNFERHNTQSGKQRALGRIRSETHRNKKRNASGVAKASPEKRREEKSIGITNVIPRDQWPDVLQTDSFEDAWGAWLSNRRDLRVKPYTSMGAKGQLTRLAKMGHSAAIAAINFSISQNYQGIVQDKSAVPGNEHGIDTNAYKEFLDGAE